MNSLAARTDKWSQTLCDAALIGILFVAPLVMGGRGPAGKFVFLCFVLLMGIGWAARTLTAMSETSSDSSLSDSESPVFQWQTTGAEPLLIGGVLLLMLQLVPLPESMLLSLSPAHADLLPTWFSVGGVQLDQWSLLSLTPVQTRAALWMFLGYATLFVLIVQQVRSIHDVERVLKWMAIAAAALALIGLAQFLLGNGKFLWIYEHPFRSAGRTVKGPFQNQNHFGHMMALGVAALIWLAQHYRTTGASREAPKRSSFRPAKSAQHMVLAACFGIGLVSLSVLLTFSRGAFLAFGVSVAVCFVVFQWKRFWGLSANLTLVAIGGLIFFALAIYGYQPLANRLATLGRSRSLSELAAGRQDLWSAILEGSQSFPLLGTGAGSQRDVHPAFMEQFHSVEYTHGESGYLPLLLETGWIGLAMMLAGASLLLFWVGSVLRQPKEVESKRRRNLDNSRYIVAAVPLCAMVLASLVHSIGDFVWYITACMSWTIIAAALAFSTYRLQREEACRSEHSRRDKERASEEVASSLSLADLWSTTRQYLVSGRTLRLDKTSALPVCVVMIAIVAASAYSMARPALAASRWSDYRRHMKRIEYARLHDKEHDDAREFAGLMAELEDVVRIDPTHSRARIHLADIYLKEFESQLGYNLSTAADVFNSAYSEASDRDRVVVLREQFGEAQFRRLIGALVQVTTASKLSPMQGHAYTKLFELAFVSNRDAERILMQAMAVRPYDSHVMFLRGRESLKQGEIEQAFESWRFAFHRDVVVRNLLLKQLQPILPVAMLIEKFHPSEDALRRMLRHYQSVTDEDYVAVSKTLEQRLEQRWQLEQVNATKGQIDFELFQLKRDSDSLAVALPFLKRAVQMEPYNYQYRKRLGTELLANAEYGEASSHLKWCLTRQPDDLQTSELLQQCTKMALLSVPEVADSSPLGNRVN